MNQSTGRKLARPMPQTGKSWDGHVLITIVVFTHDLDFGAILAATDANSPSVFQIRSQDVSPKRLSALVLSSLKQFEERLNEGALVTVNEKQARVRLLPLRRQ